jgi:putative endonuclease
MDRRELGRRAEEEVAAHLARCGFEIVARNVRLQRGELDLVVRRDDRLWFVETKCRARDDVGPPHRAVDARKRAALFAAAREYVLASGHRGDWGFLVASVVVRGRTSNITLLRRTIGPPG